MQECRGRGGAHNLACAGATPAPAPISAAERVITLQARGANLGTTCELLRGSGFPRKCLVGSSPTAAANFTSGPDGRSTVGGLKPTCCDYRATGELELRSRPVPFSIHHHQHTSPEGNLPPTTARDRCWGYARRASWAKASLPDRQSSQGVVGEGRQEEKQTSDRLTQLTVCNDLAGRGKPGGTGNTPPLAADNAAPASFSWTGAQLRGERDLDVVWRRRPPAKGNLQDWRGAKALQSSRS